MTKMIPPVPTSAVMMPTPKQKIGFSIESIVGNDASAASTIQSSQLSSIDKQTNLNQNDTTSTGTTLIQKQLLLHHHESQHLQQPQFPQTRHDIQDIINRLHNTANNLTSQNNNNNNDNLVNNNHSNLRGTYSPPPLISHFHQQQHHHHQQQQQLQQTIRLSPEVPALHLKRESSPLTSQLSLTPPPRTRTPKSPSPSPHLQNDRSPSSSTASSTCISVATTTSITTAATTASHQQQSPQQFNMPKGPIVVPSMPAGLIRPFPQQPPPPPTQPDIKALPPYISSPEMLPPPPQHPHHNPHLLAAAQFHMAAALQAGHVLGPAAAAAALQQHSPFLSGHPAAGMPRESYPLYPWLISRHGRIFPHRFPGNFLLQPFRKPKRIRTAFSPAQLLKLEHAFESNQYVVGAERKALAQNLNLSETQVKVWFQNRRTKHKRMQQEDEKGGNGGCGSNNRSGDEDDDDDELIDMEMDDDCPSDDELDASH